MKKIHSVLIALALSLLCIGCPTGNSGKLSAPILSHKTGEYDSPITVTVYSHDSFAIMYYTTDGSKPSKDHGAFIYSGNTIDIDKNTTLRIISTAPGYTDSEETKAVYKINYLEKPIISVSDGTYAYKQTVTITSNDPEAKIFYSIDPQPTSYTEYSTPIDITTYTKIMAFAKKGDIISNTAISEINIYNGSEQLIVFGRKDTNKGVLYRNNGTKEVSEKYGATEMIELSNGSIGLIGSNNTTGYFATLDASDEIKIYNLPQSGAGSDICEYNSNTYISGWARATGKLVQAYLFYKQGAEESFTPICLEEDTVTSFSKAFGVTTKDGFVYVVGTKDFDGVKKPYYWKVDLNDLSNPSVEGGIITGIQGEAIQGEAKDIAISQDGTFYITGQLNNDSYIWFGSSLSSLTEGLLCIAGTGAKLSVSGNRVFAVNSTGNLGMLYEINKDATGGHYADNAYSFEDVKFANVYAKDENNIYITGSKVDIAPDEKTTLGYSLWTKATRSTTSDYFAFGDAVLLDSTKISGTYTERNSAVAVIVK